MSRRLRAIQWAGLALLAFTAFWPVFHFQAYPIEGMSVPSAGAVFSAPGGGTSGMGYRAIGAREVPVQELGAAMGQATRTGSLVRPFWERRRWYPYCLLLFWIPALLLARRGATPRRVAGAGLWGLGLGLALFEAVYLRTEYAPFLPGDAGRAEGVVVWLLVVTLLFYRRRADRRIGAVEASVAAQALLSFAHALTLPSTMARGWWDAFDAGAVLQAVWLNFPPAFWIGCLSCLIVALPVYLRRIAQPA